MRKLATALSWKDAETARAFVASLPASDWRDPSVFEQVLSGWLRSDPARAAEVLLKHFPADGPSGEAQLSAYQSMFFRWTDKHAREASELALKLPGAIGSTLLERSVASFCFNDPNAAGQWAVALPAGETHDKILNQIGAYWTRFGAKEVTQWLDSLPPDSGKCAAIEGFAGATISTSPDDALAWLRAVPEERDRMERLRRVWSQWTDREAAQRWVETSRELTDAERNALRGASKAQ